MSIDSRLREGLTRNAEHATGVVEPALEAVLHRRRVQVRRRIAGAVTGLACLAAVTPWVYDGVRTESEPPVVAPSDDLVGSYVVQTSVLGNAGPWQVTMADGEMEIVPLGDEGAPARSATYVVEDGVLETNAFLDAPGCQLPEAYVGRYEWTRAGSTIRFRVVSNQCAARQELFGAVWEERP